MRRMRTHDLPESGPLLVPAADRSEARMSARLRLVIEGDAAGLGAADRVELERVVLGLHRRGAA